jgi:hypothetical protein
MRVCAMTPLIGLLRHGRTNTAKKEANGREDYTSFHELRPPLGMGLSALGSKLGELLSH